MDQQNDKENLALTINYKDAWAIYKALTVRIVELLRRSLSDETSEEDKAAWTSEIVALTGIATTIRPWMKASLEWHEDEIVRKETEILNDPELVAKFLNP